MTTPIPVLRHSEAELQQAIVAVRGNKVRISRTKK